MHRSVACQRESTKLADPHFLIHCLSRAHPPQTISCSPNQELAYNHVCFSLFQLVCVPARLLLHLLCSVSACVAGSALFPACTSRFKFPARFPATSFPSSPRFYVTRRPHRHACDYTNRSRRLQTVLKGTAERFCPPCHTELWRHLPTDWAALSSCLECA
jgi:hypothetical protein